MFFPVFGFELKKWLKSREFYFFILIFFLVGFISMASKVGIFDWFSAFRSRSLLANTTLGLNALISNVLNLLYFVFPSIIGMSIYRDYKYNMHDLLYAYPLKKGPFLLGKFFGSALVVFIISLFIAIGAYVATILPFAKGHLMVENSFSSYLQVYVYTVIPNILIIGSLCLCVVSLTRSIYAGFIAILIVILLQGFLTQLSYDIALDKLASILAPSGTLALGYYTKYLTFKELNASNFILGPVFIINRLLWLGISAVFVLVVAKVFCFTKGGLTINWFKTKKAKRFIKNNDFALHFIRLLKVDYSFTLKNQWQNIGAFSKMDYKYLIKNKIFIILMLVVLVEMFMAYGYTMTLFGTSTLPVTRQILLLPGETFALVFVVITFLGAGLLVGRARISKMSFLVDSCPGYPWVFMFSKFLALVYLQISLLLVIGLGGIAIQLFYGFSDIQIGLYLQDLLGIKLVYYVIWAILALCVQSLVNNYIIGLFILLLSYFAIASVPVLNHTDSLFLFNALPKLTLSDMDGWGYLLGRYWLYGVYWILWGLPLFVITYLFWPGPLKVGLKKRFAIAKSRFNSPVKKYAVLGVLAPLTLGGFIYMQSTAYPKILSYPQGQELAIAKEKKYRVYEHLPVLTLTGVDLNVDIYPRDKKLDIKGKYVLQNQTSTVIDSVLVGLPAESTTHVFLQNAVLNFKDSLHGYSLYLLQTPIEPGGVTTLEFTLHNKGSIFNGQEPLVLENGTFFDSTVLPQMGYDSSLESDNYALRESHGLPLYRAPLNPRDSLASQNNVFSNYASWIDFKTIVSTSEDQIALAPGELIGQWKKDNRNYFEYKTREKIVNYYAFNSGKYKVAKDSWQGTDLEIYYHPNHPYNIDVMMESLQKSLASYTQNYGPYGQKVLRIVEFPLSKGTFAQSFATTMPVSEGVGFVADIDPLKNQGVNYPFMVTAHETAHQWWGHQVTAAKALGAGMLLESIPEYSSLKVLQENYPLEQVTRYRQEALNKYLQGRAKETHRERALMYSNKQSYIEYFKGVLVLSALDDLLPKGTLDRVLEQFVQDNAFAGKPYPTSLDLVQKIKSSTPDSLGYFIDDHLEHITFYQNQIQSYKVSQTKDAKYQVDITANITKFRTGNNSKRIYSDKNKNSLSVTLENGQTLESFPLLDYIEIGVFTKGHGQNSDELIPLYVQKHKVNNIQNNFSIIVDQKPTVIGIDPYYKLIDVGQKANRKSL